MRISISRIVFVVALLVSLIAPLHSAHACTDFLIRTNDGASIVGRSMEWGEDLQSKIWSHPRGESRTARAPNGRSGLVWTSKYGYLGLDSHGMPLALDGMNEAGLSMGALWLPGTTYQSISDEQSSTALSVIDLGHWILGNFSSIEQVKSAFPRVRIWSPSMPQWGGQATIHLALHDAEGKSLVIEFTNGEQKIYDNPDGVLTNAPTFDWHTTNLRNYVRLSASNAQPIAIKGTILEPPGQGGGFLGIPGDWTPPSRFVRTAAMLAFAKAVTNATEGVNLALHILNAVDIPLGDVRQAPGGLDHSDYTQWAVIKDLKNRVLYFRSYDNTTVRALDLKRLKFDAGSRSRIVTPVSGGAAVTDLTGEGL